MRFMKKCTRLDSWCAGGLLPALAVVLWGRALLIWGHAPVWGTPSLQFIPWRAWGWHVMRTTGQLPWWNPDIGLGAPLIANLQSAWFYPPTWLLLGLAWWRGVEALAWGHGVLVVLHFLLAAVGMVALGRELGWRAPATGIAALAYTLSGYLATRSAIFLSMNAAAAWVPWILWAARRWTRTAALRDAVQVGVFLALQALAGHAQTSWYTGLLLTGWLLFWWWALRHGRAARPGVLPRLMGLVVMAAVAFGLSLVQLWPTWEYLQQSQRAGGVDPELALTYSFWPWRFLGLLWPNLFGSPVTGDYWGYATYWEDALYIGLLPFLLALSTWRWWRKGGPAAWAPAAVRWAWAAWALVALLALGKNTPVYPWLYAHVPTFDWFQAPARWHLISTVLLALLAGLAAEGWRPPGPRARYWLRLGLAAAGGITLVAMVAAPLAGERASIARAVAWSGVWAMGAAVLALLQPAPGHPRRALWAWAVVAWVALDLGVSHAGWTPTVDARWYRPRPATPSGRVYFPAQDEYAFKFTDFFRFKDLRPARPWDDLRALGLPNVRLLDGARTLNNFDPMRPGTFDRLLGALDDAPPGARERMLDRLAVVAEVRRAPRAARGYRVVPRQPQGLVQWYPAAEVVTTDAAAWQALWRRASLGGPAWDARITVLAAPLSGPAYPAPTSLPDPAPADRVALTWDTPTPTQVRIHVQTPGAGWLLIAQQAYPGWHATVDGRATPLYRAEYALLALPLAAGEHVVTLTYRAPGWPGTALLALVTLVGAVAVGRRFG